MTETYTGMTLYNVVEEVIEFSSGVGKVFAHNVFHGIVFMGIFGVVIAIIGMRMGLH